MGLAKEIVEYKYIRQVTSGIFTLMGHIRGVNHGHEILEADLTFIINSCTLPRVSGIYKWWMTMAGL